MDLEAKKSTLSSRDNFPTLGLQTYLSQRRDFESEESIHSYYLSYDFTEYRYP